MCDCVGVVLVQLYSREMERNFPFLCRQSPNILISIDLVSSINNEPSHFSPELKGDSKYTYLYLNHFFFHHSN